WLGEDAEDFLKGISRFSRRYTSAAPTYAIRRILQYWAMMHRKRGWKKPKDTDANNFKLQLSDLRRSFYTDETEKGLALITTSNKWMSFVRLIEVLVVAEVIPKITIGAYVRAPGKSEIITERQSVVDGAAVVSVPKSFRPDKNSYN
ncbi:hypothetical protein JTL73_33170, partial [Pseudomonas aeruginosa]|nr:hypothetical protein [Pseudomonas aeruginosa]